MEEIEENWIMLDGNVIYFNIIRKNIKNMYMRMTNEGRILITASKKCSLERIEKFIKLKKEWLFKQMLFQEEIQNEKENINLIDESNLYFLGEKYKARIIKGKKNEVYIKENKIFLMIKENYIMDSRYIKKVYENWLKEECFKIVNLYVRKYIQQMEKYKILFPEIKIKKFKSRWGCCIPKRGRIEFAMNLVKTPQKCIEYVVVHELSHFKYIYHDKKFYNFVSLFIPDWKTRRNSLNKDFGRIIV